MNVVPTASPLTRGVKVWFFVMSLVAAVALAVVAHAQPAPPPISGPIQPYGGINDIGSIKVAAIGTPSVPVVNNVGTIGSTSLVYYCVASDINGNDTVPSSSTTNTTSNATLNTTNYNIIQCGGSNGAYKYKVLKADTAHILGSCFVHGPQGGSCYVLDQGASTTSYTAQTVDQTGGAGSAFPAQHALVRQTSGLCSTSGASNAVCGEPTITGLPFADTNYTVSCTCIGTPTGAGVADYVVKAAATGGVASNAQVFIGAITQGTFSCAEVDCSFWHD